MTKLECSQKQSKQVAAILVAILVIIHGTKAIFKFGE